MIYMFMFFASTRQLELNPKGKAKKVNFASKNKLGISPNQNFRVLRKPRKLQWKILDFGSLND